MSENEKLNDYLVAWELSKPQLLAQTKTSRIYTVSHDNEKVILKLLSSSEADEQRGAVALRYFDGHGAVKLLRYDDGAQLMEYATGNSLVTLVERGEDENATRIIAQVIKLLHSVSQDAPYDGMVMLDCSFRTLLEKAAGEKQAGIDSIYVAMMPSPSDCQLTSSKFGCYTVIFITTTLDTHHEAGSHLTRKAWLVSAPTTVPTHSVTQ